jgi:TolB protein
MLAVVFCMINLDSAAEATFPGQNGKIAFSSGGNVETINPDGSGRATLTAGDEPAWNAVGSKIAFADIATTHQVYMLNGDGTGRVQVTNESLCNQPPNCYGGLSSPTFSPTGRQIAYTVSQGGHGGSFWWTNVMDIDTGAVTGSVSYVSNPTWSPSGSKIAFEGANGGIQTADPDGTNLVELTNEYYDGSPSWSPNGQKIAFTHIDSASGTYGIYTINADGSNRTRLTDQLDFDPAWSPDGTKIAFDRPVQTAPTVVEPDLFVMNADGTGEVDITPGTSAAERRPDWQPLPPVGYARPRAATPVNVRLVPAHTACASPNMNHGPPLTGGSCNPPTSASDYLTVGTPDSNLAAANFTGSVVLKASSPSPDPSDGDQANVSIQTDLTDVRNRSNLLDYAGEIKVVLPLRMTDRNGGNDYSPYIQPTTATDTPLSLTVACTPTDDASIGSTCSATTTADALLPGLVLERKRSVWGLGQVQVFDGGSDGDADTTGDNTLFAEQGLFVP